MGSLRAIGSPESEQLETSAKGAASLLLFSPLTVDDCPTAFVLNYDVRFHLY